MKVFLITVALIVCAALAVMQDAAQSNDISVRVR
jgi:hypothetical protein